MEEIHLGILFSALFVLILLSAFFSGSETAMMALNRYRLRHLARAKHKGAMRASKLLERPDRLISLILLGNNFVNILASAIATVIALRVLGEIGIAIAAILLTVIILIFAEVTPKTIAALFPERIAFPATYVLNPLLKLLYPFVWVINAVANGLIRQFGISPEEVTEAPLTPEELRSIVRETGPMISARHKQMLISILDLEKAAVEDIMVPRNEMAGIDLDDDEDEIMESLTNYRHTRLPVYRGDVDNVIGILHSRKVPRLFADGEELSIDALKDLLDEPHYVPEGTHLHTQLLNFQRSKERIGLVVDEYGVIQGLITLEDILEEIVGEFTTDPQPFSRDIYPMKDGSYLVDGGAHIRELNRALNWDLPTEGPKTLNGLVLEHLETIPEPGTSLRIGRYTVEIVQTTRNAVKTAQIRPYSSGKEITTKETLDEQSE